MPVYWIQKGVDGPVRVGFSVDPKRRLEELQCVHIETLSLVATRTEGDEERDRDLLKKIRKRFAKIGLGNGWFRPSGNVFLEATRGNGWCGKCDGCRECSDCAPEIRRIVENAYGLGHVDGRNHYIMDPPLHVAKRTIYQGDLITCPVCEEPGIDTVDERVYPPIPNGSVHALYFHCHNIHSWRVAPKIDNYKVCGFVKEQYFSAEEKPVHPYIRCRASGCVEFADKNRLCTEHSQIICPYCLGGVLREGICWNC